MTTMGSPGTTARVGVVMGSASDWATLRHAAETLAELGIPHEREVVSAHRTPERLRSEATGRSPAGARGRGTGDLGAVRVR